MNYSLSVTAFLKDKHCSAESFSPRHTVRTMISVTAYGSQFEAGRRSSKYPHLSSPTCRGIRTDAPRLAIPALN